MNCGCNLRLRRVWTWALRLMAGVGVLAGIYGIVWVGVYLTVSGVPLSGGAMTSAYFECHRRVSDQLSPDGRVDFPQENYENVSEAVGEKTYRFDSYVTVRRDTQPDRRYDYICTLEYRGLDYWPLPSRGEPWRIHELAVKQRRTLP